MQATIGGGGAQMIFKLSLKNLKAHVPNYLVYYISMTLQRSFIIVSVDRLQPASCRRCIRDIEIKRSLGLGSTLVTIIILGFMLQQIAFIGRT